MGRILIHPLYIAAVNPGGSGQITGFLLLFGPIILIWWFLVLRPQSKNRQKTQSMLAALKTGDKVVTNGGLLGTVVGFRDSVVQLQVASQVKVEVLRSSIAGLQAEPSDNGGKRTEEPDKAETAAKGKKP
ncbi:MAG TPA: preprotein translocase subunit YajC [Terriglobia bacterium]|nr:preprotein translocase subunit YajC [Terriglobia bacterium]